MITAVLARQFWAILKKDVLLEYSYRLQFVLNLAGVFLELAMFFFLAKLVKMPARMEQYGGNYFAFLAVGLAFGQYQWISLYTFAQSLREQQVMGTLEMIFASPMRPETLIVGSSLWTYLFETIVIVLNLGMAALFFGLDLSHANLFSALVVIIMTILAMSAFGVLSAAFIVVFKRGDPVTWVFATVSGLLGGIYYPIEVLPPVLKSLSALLPITHALKAIRLAVLKGYPVQRLSTELIVLGVFAVFLLPVSLFAFRRAVNIARRDGTLSQY